MEPNKKAALYKIVDATGHKTYVIAASATAASEFRQKQLDADDTGDEDWHATWGRVMRVEHVSDYVFVVPGTEVLS